MATLAITGATGFVGGHLVKHARSAGHIVHALTRRAQTPSEGLVWIEGDLADEDALSATCDGADAVIHVAGAINAASRAGFDRANVGGTEAMIRAATRAGTRRFVQVSSLAAREPGLSDYGSSKAAADALVHASELDWAIVRPPAVYGEGDRETLELVRAVARGFAPSIGQGRFSLIHVADLAGALLALALAPGVPHAVFEVDDGHAGGVSHADFARAVGAAVGRQPRILPIPVPLLRSAAILSEWAAAMTGRRPKLSRDRARYFAHPDWVADSRPIRATGLWAPQIPLADGLRRTIAWYRTEGWL